MVHEIRPPDGLSIFRLAQLVIVLTTECITAVPVYVLFIFLDVQRRCFRQPNYMHTSTKYYQVLGIYCAINILP